MSGARPKRTLGSHAGSGILLRGAGPLGESWILRRSGSDRRPLSPHPRPRFDGIIASAMKDLILVLQT